jgi:hypothetical protein
LSPRLICVVVIVLLAPHALSPFGMNPIYYYL